MVVTMLDWFFEQIGREGGFGMASFGSERGKEELS
jgi:hypothetical protein